MPYHTIPYHAILGCIAAQMLHFAAYAAVYWHAVEAKAHCALVWYIVTLQSSLVTIVLKIGHPTKLYKQQYLRMSQHPVQ